MKGKLGDLVNVLEIQNRVDPLTKNNVNGDKKV